MADEKRTSAIDEEITLEEQLHNIQLAHDRKQAELRKKNRKEEEDAIANYRLSLELKGQNVTQQQEIQFLKEYEAMKKQAAVNAVIAEQQATTQQMIDFYKQKSKFGEKEQKDKQKQLDRELEIAKLRSTVKIDENGNEVDKTKGEMRKDTIAADLKENFDTLKNGFKESMSGLGKRIANLGDALSGEINSVISVYSEYQSSINTRLQGSDKTFQSIEKNLTKTLGNSPYMKTADMLENLNTLVDQGINFNIDQRAFLMSISDKIATTFEVANSSLLRIVQLQQQDSTAARLGMEAYLTRYFNELFKDTSYLSQTFDNVTAALIEATGRMSREGGVEFEYQIQKWLGALSSVGMSSNTAEAIAQAIGYLGSGNINALMNSNLQNLLVMGANRGGLDYSTLLTEGLDGATANELMKGVVLYLREIGQSESNVVLSQYAETFGVTVSDFKSALNLGDAAMKSLCTNLMSYSATLDELREQFDKVASRTSVAEMINNVMSNIKYDIGLGIASNPVMAGMWQITDLIQNVTGGIPIPTISVFGYSLDLETTVENLIKTGIVGVSALSKIGNLFTGLANAGNMGGLIEKFGIGNSAYDVLKQGEGLAGRSKTLSTSSTAYVGSFSGGDIQDQYLNEENAKGKKKQQEQKEQSNERTTTDVFDYLTQMFDPKFNMLLEMTAATAGFDYREVKDTISPTGEASKISLGTKVSVSTAALPEGMLGKDAMSRENHDNIASIFLLLKDVVNGSSSFNTRGLASDTGGGGSGGLH